jgi:hypothetical protein
VTGVSAAAIHARQSDGIGNPSTGKYASHRTPRRSGSAGTPANIHGSPIVTSTSGRPADTAAPIAAASPTAGHAVSRHARSCGSFSYPSPSTVTSCPAVAKADPSTRITRP